MDDKKKILHIEAGASCVGTSRIMEIMKNYDERLDSEEIKDGLNTLSKRIDLFGKTGKVFFDESAQVDIDFNYFDRKQKEAEEYVLSKYSDDFELLNLEEELKHEKNPMRKKQLAREISKMRIKNKMMRG